MTKKIYRSVLAAIWMGAVALSGPAVDARPAAGAKPETERAKADPLLPSINIAEVDQAPTVDGVLDDPCWAKAEESQVFTDSYSYPLKVKTTFQMCQKDEVLYLAIRSCYDAKGRKKTNENATHDANMWGGEVFEMFMDLDNDDTPGYYQFVLTPFDVTSDLYCYEQRDPEKRWEPKYQVKSKWSEQEWTIEYGIPLAAFDRSKTIYENFGLNLHLNASAWSPGHTEGWHYPMKFGEARGLKGITVTSNEAGLFRGQFMKVNDRVIKAKADTSLIPEKQPAFESKPEVKLSGSSAQIGFEVNTFTDVAVWIEDAKGERIRHLAAGMLGGNPPAPLKKDSLKQSLVWDYLDDFGKKAPAGQYKVKVGVGSKAVLDKEIGRNETPKGINGLAVGPDGSIYTIGGIRDEWTDIMKFDRNGKFLSMLLPPPADVPVEKLKGLNIIDYGPDGQVRFGSHRMATILPSLDQPFPQTLLINSKGQLIFAGCEYPAGPARFYKINADGSLPDDFIGPYIKDIGWLTYFRNWAKRFHFALDPLDEDVIYLSGLKEMHSDETWAHPPGTNPEVLPGRKEIFYNAVCRVRWGQDAPLETFAGKRNTIGIAHSDKPGEFFDPQGIAFDKDNNMWVCDRRNHRIQVLDHSGKFLREFPHPGPYEVSFDRKTGNAYVLGIEGEEPTLNSVHEMAVRKGVITKYDRSTPPKVLARCELPGSWNYWWTMALDVSAARPELKLVWTGDGREKNSDGEAYRILSVQDLGDRFAEPKLVVGQNPPATYYRIAAGWDSDIICAGPSWFDANSGRYLGKMAAKELVAARDGRWVTRYGFAPEGIEVFPESWATNPAAPALTNWLLVPHSLTRAGERGFYVTPNSDVYVARYYNWTDVAGGRASGEGADHHVAIDRYTIDGKMIGKRVVHELSGGAHSPVVDIRGNIYVSDNLVRKIGQFYEDDVASNLPSWVQDFGISAADWDTLRSGNKVEAGYMKFVHNPLTKAVGTIYKFGPKGGGVLWRAGQGKYQPGLVIHQPQTNAQGQLTGKYPDWGYPIPPLPKRPATHWSGTMLDWGECGLYPAWLEGVEWEFPGSSPAWGRFSKGHEACICFSLRFCADDFGRIYVPAAHRNTIRMIDTAGNEVLRIGRYGNLDSGPSARLKEPNIPLWFPTATALSKRYLYVVEARLARVLRIKLGYAVEESGNVTVK